MSLLRLCFCSVFFTLVHFSRHNSPLSTFLGLVHFSMQISPLSTFLGRYFCIFLHTFAYFCILLHSFAYFCIPCILIQKCFENDSKVFDSLRVLKLFVRIEVIAAIRALGGLVFSKYCFFSL